MSEFQQWAQQWLDQLVSLLPVSYAFGAGMVSTVNPCGFAMLPAYLSLYLGAEQGAFYQQSVWFRTLKGLIVGLSVSAGFVLLFALAGVVISAGGTFVIVAMPWIGVVIGLGLAILGLWMLAGGKLQAEFFTRLASKIGDPRVKSLKGFFMFGVAFGAASLS